MTYKTIIVAVDNDATSEQVCECAHALAQACDATITLIHVIEPLYPVAMPGAIGVVPVSSGPTDEEHQQRIKGYWQVNFLDCRFKAVLAF